MLLYLPFVCYVDLVDDDPHEFLTIHGICKHTSPLLIQQQVSGLQADVIAPLVYPCEQHRAANPATTSFPPRNSTSADSVSCVSSVIDGISFKTYLIAVFKLLLVSSAMFAVVNRAV